METERKIKKGLLILGPLMLLGGFVVCLMMAGHHISVRHEVGIAAYLSMIVGVAATAYAIPQG